MILSNTSSIAYYEQIEVLNNILLNEVQDSIDSSQLFYASNNQENENDKQISGTTNNTLKDKKKHVINEIPILNQVPFIWGKDVSNNNTNTCFL